MAITAVAPAQSNGGAESGNLEDITHGCVQCGTTLTRTVRQLAEDERETALRA
jgi:ferredoxin-like protein FixX